jgi:hypothetical protein
MAKDEKADCREFAWAERWASTLGDLPLIDPPYVPGRVEGKVTCSGTVKLDDPRCECGSGSNLRGPGHSDYCQLWLKA